MHSSLLKLLLLLGDEVGRLGLGWGRRDETSRDETEREARAGLGPRRAVGVKFKFYCMETPTAGWRGGRQADCPTGGRQAPPSNIKAEPSPHTCICSKQHP